jgi:hypothetical protein
MANEVEPLHHHLHKMVGFTLGMLQRHLTCGHIGKSQWQIQDFLNGTYEGCLESPPPSPVGPGQSPGGDLMIRTWKLTKYSILSCIRRIKIMNIFLKIV